MKNQLIKRRSGRRQNVTLSMMFKAFQSASKREKLIFSTLSITACVLLTSLAAFPLWIVPFVLTNLIVVCLVLFSLWNDLGSLRFFFVPIFPLTYTSAFLLDLLVIPMHPLIRFLSVGIFGVVMYLMLLVSNIFNIAAVKTIPLMRPAHAASFSLNVVIVFFLIFFSFTLKVNPVLLAFIAGFLTFWPSLYLLWSFELSESLPQRLVVNGLIIAFIIAQTTLVFSFWPVSPLFSTLFLTTIFYVCAGIVQQAHLKRLRAKIVAEYFAVLIFAFLLVLINAQWGG